MTERKFSYNVEDISNRLDVLRSVVYLFAQIGDAKANINADTLGYAFCYILTEIEATQEALDDLEQRMREAEKNRGVGE